jgi:threonine dehydratase
MISPPKFADIEAAQSRISGSIMQTPCLLSETLSQIAGCSLFLKFENLQFTASFKERGALNKLLILQSGGQRIPGVSAMSAGNHAQGVAYHAKRLDIPATIVMPRGTPFTKIRRTEDHGARVIVDGANLSESLSIANRLSELEGLAFIHPFDDPDVVAGQGTVAFEILAAISDLDAIVVPVGGGGLISGIALVAKHLKPGIKIYGVQSRTYPSMQKALTGDEAPCIDGTTIAEGIAVKTAGLMTREVVRSFVDDIILVDETSIEQSVALLLSVEKTVVEGAGASGLAAIIANRERFAGLRVATLLSGGNIDLRILASVAMRELVRSEQLIRFEVAISDQPGALSLLSTALGEAGVNIVDVAHDRLSLSLNPKGAVLDVVAEVQDSKQIEIMFSLLENIGLSPKRKPM